MATPQQPELQRNRRSPADPGSAKSMVETRGRRPRTRTPREPVPEENQPGHHPPLDQDKPIGPPKLPPRHHRFGFARGSIALAGVPFGVTPTTAFVDADDDRLVIRFGPWHLRTPIDNVEAAEATGPYKWWKVIGPPHLSFTDRGVTFATATDRGVCIRFKEPVSVLVPESLPLAGHVRHPSITVTVDEPEDLVRFLSR